jgi:hypothetical protein
VIEHPLRSLRKKYDEISMQLLQADSVPGLDERALESFKKTYGPSILICRTSNCPRGLQGFDTIQERDAHEATHQLRCPHVGCIFHRTGMGSEKKLKDHIAASHPEDSASAVAPPIRPFGEERVDTDATLVGSPERRLKDGLDSLPSDLDEGHDEDLEDAFFPHKLEAVAKTDGFALRTTDWT